MLKGPKVICIGNRNMGDDAAGQLVADILEERGWRDIVRVESPLEAMDTRAEAEEVLIVDAVKSDLEAGRIIIIDSPERLSELGCSLSTHTVDLCSVLRLLEAIGSMPERMRIYGISGKDFSPDQGPSEAILEACRRVAGMLEERLLKGLNEEQKA